MLFDLEVYFSRDPKVEINKVREELDITPLGGVSQQSSSSYVTTYSYLERQKALRVVECFSGLEGVVAIKMLKCL